MFATILGALEKNYAGQVQAILIGIPAFFVSGLLTLAGDEQTIFAQAINVLLADIKAGKGWEPALTDMYNTFYNGEVSEGHKLAMAFLEWIAKTVSSLAPAA